MTEEGQTATPDSGCQQWLRSTVAILARRHLRSVRWYRSFGHTENENCERPPTKFLGCWPCHSLSSELKNTILTSTIH